MISVIAVAVLVSACGSADTRRKARKGEDAGPDATPVPTTSAPPDAAADAKAPPGPLVYFGSSGSSGGVVMQGGGYILFGVTGEVPGTSGLSKNADHKMVGGVVGHASY